MSSPSKSSDSPAAAAAASPSKPSSNNASVPTSFKNKIAAFESGLAANASKVDQSKQIPHADLSNLRSRFDKEGEKPLQVKGSFGLGAAPPKHLLNPSGNATSGGRGDGGQRAVSLGIGRAVSPIQSPTVVLPGPSPTGILGRSVSSSAGAGGPPSTSTSTSSASASSRPLAARSDSTNSNSTSATSTTSISGNTATSTASSLLPGPLAALRGSSSGGGGGIGSPNSPYGGIGGGSRGSEDDSMSAGLRTPMSSISLSSMQVEAGSTIGDAASSSGDTTANEDEGVTADSDKADKQARTILAPELVTTPTDVTGLTNARTEGLELSAAALEKRKEELEEGGEAQQGGNRRGGDNDDSQMEGAIRPPQDAVERAAEELDKYTHEEPSQTAVMSPPLQSSSSMSQLTVPGTEDVDDETTSSNNNDNNTGNKLPSPPSSAKKSPSRPLSMTSGPRERLKRSSTANSIASAASHPESDLADTNLENFDAQAATGSDDVDKAQNTAESMVPTNSSNPSDAPTVPAVITSPGDDDDDDIVTEEDIAFAQDKQEFAPINEGEATEELDEEGMPLVKCSDCGSKVSLVKLGEHACSAITPSASRIAFPSTGDSTKEDQEKASLNGLEQYARDRRETGPEDVPTDDLSPEPMPSPQMSHRSVTSSRPDVPDDASVSSLSAGLEDMSLNENSSYKKTQLPQDEDEIETADLVSREEGSSVAYNSAGATGNHGNDGVPVSTEVEDGEEDYMTALTSRRDSMDTPNTQPMEFMSNAPAGSILDTRASQVDSAAALDNHESDEETEELALGMSDVPINTPRMGSFGETSVLTSATGAGHRDSPTPDRDIVSPTTTSNNLPEPNTPQNNKTAPSLSTPAQDPANLRRRSSAGKRNKNLGDTDSEGEIEPGTVTIIR